MTNKAMKYGLMTIATVLLIAVLCMGAVSATTYSDYTYDFENHQYKVSNVPITLNQGDVVEIADLNELKALANFTNNGNSTVGITWRLTADIDLESPHTPIGVSSTPFRGIFDGDNHSMGNCVGLEFPKLEGNGIFGQVSNVTIKNLIIKDLPDMHPNGWGHFAVLAGKIVDSQPLDEQYRMTKTVPDSDGNNVQNGDKSKYANHYENIDIINVSIITPWVVRSSGFTAYASVNTSLWIENCHMVNFSHTNSQAVSSYVGIACANSSLAIVDSTLDAHDIYGGNYQVGGVMAWIVSDGSFYYKNLTATIDSIRATGGGGTIGSLVAVVGGNASIAVIDCDVKTGALNASGENVGVGGLFGSVPNGAVLYVKDTSVECDYLVGKNVKTDAGGLIGTVNNATVTVVNTSVKDTHVGSNHDSYIVSTAGGLFGKIGTDPHVRLSGCSVINCSVNATENIGTIVGSGTISPLMPSVKMLTFSEAFGNNSKVTATVDEDGYDKNKFDSCVVSFNTAAIPDYIVAPQVVDNGDKITEPSAKPMTHNKWYEDSLSGEQWDFDTVVVAKASNPSSLTKTLYGEAVQNTTEVTYYIGDTKYENKTYTCNHSVELPINPEIAGYAFNGWNVSSADGIFFSNVSGTINSTYYSEDKWIFDERILSLYANGTVNTTEVTASGNKAVFSNYNVTAIHSPEDNVVQVLLENVSNVANGIVTFTADNTTVVEIPDVAGYNKDEIAVFEITASSLGTAKINITVTFANESTATAKKDNVSFYHYNTTNNAWDTQPLTIAAMVQTDEKVLYTVETTSFSPFGISIYTPITYTVHFDANGGVGSMADMTFTYDEGQNLTANTFQRYNSNFLYWTYNGTKYYNTDFVKNLTLNQSEIVVMKAQWEGYSTGGSSSGSTYLGSNSASYTPTQQPTVKPTIAPTAAPTEQPATPTVIATAKPTTQATQQSPAPFVGLLAGLGAAAVLLRLRK